MNRNSRIAVVALALAAGALAPATAQYANEYVPPKLLTRGTTSQSIAGTGKVVIQVQVNANGSHKVIKVIHSTNSGDNKAAIEIAQTSSYRPATRGGKAVTAFYDYTLKFTGKSVAASDATTGSATGQIERMIRAGNYAGAKEKANAYLIGSPGDTKVRALLGVADFYTNDYEGSAQAFAMLPSVEKNFKPVAAHAFASAAASLASKNPTLAVTYGQKALALDPSANSLYALGAAQLGAGDTSNAIANLKKARDLAFSAKGTDVKSRVNLDAMLMQAYLKAGDTQNAQTTANQIKQLDPTSSLPGQVMGSALIQSGQAASKAKQHDAAIKDFEQAAAMGSPQVAVTANTLAAFEVANMEKPDYTKMKGYADKALAIKADDAMANYAEGVALTGIWAGNRSDDSKKQAMAACAKAEQYARAEGNEALALQIESFVKNNIK